MPARRVPVHRLQELVRLHRMGSRPRKVARLLGMSPKTEQAYRTPLEAAGLLRGDPNELPELAELRRIVEAARPPAPSPRSVSTVAAWRPAIEGMFLRGVPPKAIHDWLRLTDPDYPKEKYQAVKRLCQRIRRERGVREEDVPIPVVTLPGEVAQVDFGYAGYLYDPETGSCRKAWVFVLVLCHSRHMWADIVFDQRTETWLSLHARAFADLGGVPRTLRPDRLKAAVVRSAFGLEDDKSLNQSYVELARHFGFQIDPTPPRQPRKKGKVESAVKYIKQNYLKAHRPEAGKRWDVRDARAGLRRWVRDIAGQREHGTTHRVPLEVFEAEERTALGSLPSALWEPVTWKVATVHPDFHVQFEKRLYSVPWNHAGKEVWIKATPTSLYVYWHDERIATHSRSASQTRVTLDEHLPKDRGPWSHRSRGYWEDRAGRLGEEVAIYVREVFDSADVLTKLRTVQAIVTCLERFPLERARAAVARARHFDNHTYGGLKNILVRGLDLAPLPEDEIEWQTSLPNPRFARSASEFTA